MACPAPMAPAFPYQRANLRSRLLSWSKEEQRLGNATWTLRQGLLIGLLLLTHIEQAQRCRTEEQALITRRAPQ